MLPKIVIYGFAGGFLNVLVASSDTQSLISLAEWIYKTGPYGLLITFIYFLASGKLRWQREVIEAENRTKEMRQERDEWKLMSLELSGVATRAANSAQKASNAAAVAATRLPDTPNTIG